MKFLHAADIHLDSPLTGLRARADLPPGITHHCTRRAFAAMIDLALAEDVAFVVIAGNAEALHCSQAHAKKNNVELSVDRFEIGSRIDC